MDWKDLLEWWNLLFVLPFTLAVALVMLSCTGVLHSDHDVDADADGDVAADVGHDVNMEHDVSMEHDAGTETGDHDAEHDTEDGGWWRALSFLGVGKVPLSIILTTFLLIWGFAGWASNMFFRQFLPPWMFVWISAGIALAGSASLTKAFAGVMQKIMPTTETYGFSNEDLVGKTAEALFDISERFGRARVKDNTGNIHDVDCLVRAGKEAVKKGSRVVLVEYEKEQRCFFVRQDPLNS